MPAFQILLFRLHNYFPSEEELGYQSSCLPWGLLFHLHTLATDKLKCCSSLAAHAAVSLPWSSIASVPLSNSTSSQAQSMANALLPVALHPVPQHTRPQPASTWSLQHQLCNRICWQEGYGLTSRDELFWRGTQAPMFLNMSPAYPRGRAPQSVHCSPWACISRGTLASALLKYFFFLLPSLCHPVPLGEIPVKLSNASPLSLQGSQSCIALDCLSLLENNAITTQTGTAICLLCPTWGQRPVYAPRAGVT